MGYDGIEIGAHCMMGEWLRQAQDPTGEKTARGIMACGRRPREWEPANRHNDVCLSYIFNYAAGSDWMLLAIEKPWEPRLDYLETWMMGNEL